MRSEAQKRADKKYLAAHKNDYVKFQTMLKPGEAEAVDELIKQNGMTRADFIRWAAAELKKQNEEKAHGN